MGHSMWDAGKTLARVDQAMADGELWRAKQILQGCIATKAYLPALYERYGQVLLQMGDTVEAGRHLFLSGSRRPEYEHAIALFRAKHGNVPARQLFASFPRRAKLTRIDDYPDALAHELRALGLPDDLPQHLQTYKRDNVTGCAIGAWIVGIALLVMVLWSIAGIYWLARWLIRLVFG